MKPLGVVWFCGRKDIGVVVGHDDVTNKSKAYILPIEGRTVTTDIKNILETGSKFPLKEAVALIEKQGTLLVEPKEWVKKIHTLTQKDDG